VDYVFNPKHYAFVRYSKASRTRSATRSTADRRLSRGSPGLVDTFRDPWNVAANWRWNPGKNLVNEFVVGGNHFTFDFITPTADTSRLEYSTAGFPTGTAITLPESFAVGNLRTLNTLQIVNNTSYNRGAHSFKLGLNVRLQSHEDVRGSVSGGNVTRPSTSVRRRTPSTRAPSTCRATSSRPTIARCSSPASIWLLGRVGQISQGFVSTGSAYAPGGTPFVFATTYPEIDVFLQEHLEAGLESHDRFLDCAGRPSCRPQRRGADTGARTSVWRWAKRRPARSPDRRAPLRRTTSTTSRRPSASRGTRRGAARQVIRANYRLAYDRSTRSPSRRRSCRASRASPPA
jgi:hypothetical protein